MHTYRWSHHVPVLHQSGANPVHQAQRRRGMYTYINYSHTFINIMAVTSKIYYILCTYIRSMWTSINYMCRCICHVRSYITYTCAFINDITFCTHMQVSTNQFSVTTHQKNIHNGESGLPGIAVYIYYMKVPFVSCTYVRMYVCMYCISVRMILACILLSFTERFTHICRPHVCECLLYFDFFITLHLNACTFITYTIILIKNRRVFHV